MLRFSAIFSLLLTLGACERLLEVYDTINVYKSDDDTLLKSIEVFSYPYIKNVISINANDNYLVCTKYNPGVDYNVLRNKL